MGSFKLKLVLYFALLALLPTAIAFYGFNTLAQRSETRRVDAAEEQARTLARSPRLQAALRDRDEATAAELAVPYPNMTIESPGFKMPGRIRGGATRTVNVIDHGKVLGKLIVAVPLDDRLLRRVRSSLDPRDELVAVEAGRIVVGPHRGSRLPLVAGRAARVHV